MSNLEEIKAITFDADGTLWDFKKVMKYSLKFVLSALEDIDPIAASMLDIDKMIEIRNKIAKDLKGIVFNLEEIRLRAFIETLNVINKPNEELAKYLNEIYLKHRFEDIELYNDVIPTLQKLKGKYILGIISNGNSYPEKCGLEDIFDFIIFSQDHGVEKPDPAIFDIALRLTGCEKSQMIHIGDCLNCDVLGAIKSGIHSVWLNRNNSEKPSKCEIEIEIHSLIELLEILSV